MKPVNGGFETRLKFIKFGLSTVKLCLFLHKKNQILKHLRMYKDFKRTVSVISINIIIITIIITIPLIQK